MANNSAGATSAPAALVGGRRRLLTRNVAYLLATAVIALGLFASVTPSPIYGLYSELWHFSPLTLTLVYASYAFGVLATLLLAGRLSDDVGRRPVLLGALALLMASTVLFMLATSVAWLFVARALQGLATGAALSTASAALLDLHPRRDPVGVGLTNGVASAGGLGLGILVSSVIVQLNWAPRLAPYALLLVLFALVFAGALFMPETVVRRFPLRLRVERPRLPASVRPQFLVASLAVLSSWSIGGLFFSLGPQLAARLFSTSQALVPGAAISALALSAALAQLLLGRRAPWVATAGGSLALAAGIGAVVLAASTGSSAAFVGGAVVGGLGFGLAFLGGLRGLIAVIPADHRGAVMSAFYIVAYAALSIPAVLAGVLVTHLGLQRTFEGIGLLAAAIALFVAAIAWRTRPQPAPAVELLARSAGAELCELEAG